MSERLDALLRWNKEPIDQRLAHEAVKAFQDAGHPYYDDLLGIVRRAVRTAFLVECIAFKQWAGDDAEKAEEEGKQDVADAFYSTHSLLSGREHTYREWVAVAEKEMGS